jgi:hypothetical protein
MKTESIRAIAFFLAGVIAILLFVVGLLSPLTPSEGRPSTPHLLMFLGLPLLVSGGGLYLSRKMAERLLMVVVLMIVVIFSVMVLIPIFRTTW